MGSPRTPPKPIKLPRRSSNPLYSAYRQTSTTKTYGLQLISLILVVVAFIAVTAILFPESAEEVLEKAIGSPPATNFPTASQTPVQAVSLPSFLPLATQTKELTPTPPLTPSPASTFIYDPQALQQQALTLINQDRQRHSLNPVGWDQTAAQAGVVHAQDMVENGYFSHWNLAGLGPDHRYSLAGGKHAVMENLHAFSYKFDNGQGAPIEDWEVVIVQAQEGLMNSPGHRANILDPAHTHVGIGMAYDAASGQFYLAQEFSNQYVTLAETLPLNAQPGSNLLLRGQINEEDLSRLLFSLAYEPFPAPLSLQELAQRSTYTSLAESVEVRALDMVFDEAVILGNQPGLYHVRLFVDIAGQQVLVMDHVVWVGQP